MVNIRCNIRVESCILFVSTFVIFGESFIIQNKLNEDFKVRVKRQIYEPLLGKAYFWHPHGYFNLCPFVRPLPYDFVWNVGCTSTFPRRPQVPVPQQHNANNANNAVPYTHLQESFKNLQELAPASKPVQYSPNHYLNPSYNPYSDAYKYIGTAIARDHEEDYLQENDEDFY